MNNVVTAHQLRQNLKQVVDQVLAGNEVILKYGSKAPIKISIANPASKVKTKHQLFKEKLQEDLAKIKSGKLKLRKSSYKNNRELYDDIYKTLIK